MAENNEITFFAKTNFRNQERVFGIKPDDRRRHMYVIGKTGMGKTNLLENMVIQDIRNGHGVCYIDPHGDTAEKLLKSIPSERINDVIYFNPADQQFPIAYNVMEAVDPEYRHLISSGLIGVFKKIWADSWGPRLEYILRNALLALLEYPGSTLLGVTRILVDKKYRERVVEKVSDPVVKMFWTEEFTKWNDKVIAEVISPIQNKVGQFLSSSLIRNIVGQTQSTFDVRDLMDQRKILILNLSKGRIGEDNSALLGAMMITKIQLAAMARVDISEEDRKDFYLYVDEFQNFATESFANILSEARKYRLNLILANQYIEQIDEKVRDAIFGNAGTIISFRVGAQDAEFLEKEYEPVFMQTDIVNLPKYNIYLKLMIDGIAGDAFSATTLPPIHVEETRENEEKIIKVSRQRYTGSKQDVEEKIARWSGMVLPGSFVTTQPVAPQPQSQRPIAQSMSQPQPVVQPIVPPQPQEAFDPYANPAYDPNEPVNIPRPVDPDKPMFDSQCDTCGVDIKVPFKPDGKRPTFCKDCLKDYQKMTAKARLGEERRAQRQQQANPATAQQPQMSQPQARPAYNPAPKREEYKKPEKQIEPKSFVSTEKPLSLSQMQHMAPKAFKPDRKRPQVNLDDVRNLIKNTQQNSPTTPTSNEDDDQDRLSDSREGGR